MAIFPFIRSNNYLPSAGIIPPMLSVLLFSFALMHVLLPNKTKLQDLPRRCLVTGVTDTLMTDAKPASNTAHSVRLPGNAAHI